MAELKNARKEARNEVEGKAAASKKIEPAPRGSNDAPEAEQVEAKEPIALVVIASNPKRPASESYRIYEHYKKSAAAGELTSVEQVREDGVRGKDITWDKERYHIAVGDDAIEFAGLKDNEAKNEWLKKKGVSEKNRIKWGYMEAPKEEVKAEEQEKATA